MKTKSLQELILTTDGQYQAYIESGKSRFILTLEDKCFSYAYVLRDVVWRDVQSFESLEEVQEKLCEIKNITQLKLNQEPEGKIFHRLQKHIGEKFDKQTIAQCFTKYEGEENTVTFDAMFDNKDELTTYKVQSDYSRIYYIDINPNNQNIVFVW